MMQEIEMILPRTGAISDHTRKSKNEKKKLPKKKMEKKRKTEALT
jgi:hypothetical protein